MSRNVELFRVVFDMSGTGKFLQLLPGRNHRSNARAQLIKTRPIERKVGRKVATLVRRRMRRGKQDGGEPIPLAKELGDRRNRRRLITRGRTERQTLGRDAQDRGRPMYRTGQLIRSIKFKSANRGGVVRAWGDRSYPRGRRRQSRDSERLQSQLSINIYKRELDLMGVTDFHDEINDIVRREIQKQLDRVVRRLLEQGGGAVTRRAA